MDIPPWGSSISSTWPGCREGSFIMVMEIYVQDTGLFSYEIRHPQLNSYLGVLYQTTHLGVPKGLVFPQFLQCLSVFPSFHPDSHVQVFGWKGAPGALLELPFSFNRSWLDLFDMPSLCFWGLFVAYRYHVMALKFGLKSSWCSKTYGVRKSEEVKWLWSLVLHPNRLYLCHFGAGQNVLGSLFTVNRNVEVVMYRVWG